MPKPGKKVSENPQPQASSKGITWNVEESTEACDYRLGKLTLGKAVVGEITIIKTEFPRVSSVLSQLGVNVRLDE